MTVGNISTDHDGTSFVSEEQIWRANTYGVLSALLAREPDDNTLNKLRVMTNDSSIANEKSPMALAWSSLIDAANNSSTEDISNEFQDMFIGVGCGEITPYGSWYITGFLMEKPLAELRQTLARLGMERLQGIRESEDHIAALCDVMRILIMDEIEQEDSFSLQQDFFTTHIEPWGLKLFKDMQMVRSAKFYKCAGALGQKFIEIEMKYLSMTV